MRYIGQRLLQFVTVFIVVTFLVMVATRIGSTDPARDLAGGAVSEAQIEQVNEDYPYLDDPLPVQYVHWLKDIVTGDWGRSYVASQDNLEMFQQRMPPTVFIAFWSIVIGLLIAVPLGVYSAYRRDRRVRSRRQHRLVRRDLDAAARRGRAGCCSSSSRASTGGSSTSRPSAGRPTWRRGPIPSPTSRTSSSRP